MSNLGAPGPVENAAAAASLPAPAFEARPGNLTSLGAVPIHRLLPRAGRRLVGPWCFADRFDARGAAIEMDVPPHPHIGLQTVSWLLEGRIHHRDSLGEESTATPGVLNLMTAGRGIAHAEVTPEGGVGALDGVQLWVALPAAERATAPAFARHEDLPVASLDGGRVTVIVGAVAGHVSPARAFSPIVGAEIAARSRVVIPLEAGWEHALVMLRGAATLEGRELTTDTLYYLGGGRSEIALECRGDDPRALLLGGAPFGEPVLMWWNFVARTPDEVAAARDDWAAGARFGEVRGYRGRRLDAPPLLARPTSG
jgi:redox-sensitive bicupin YhaK (pirin superfamily)